MLFALKKLDCSSAYSLIFDLFRSEDAYLRNAAVSIFGAGGDDAVALSLPPAWMRRTVRCANWSLDALMETGLPDARLAIRARAAQRRPQRADHGSQVPRQIAGRRERSSGRCSNSFGPITEPMLRATDNGGPLLRGGHKAPSKLFVSLLMPGEGVNDPNGIYLPPVDRETGRHGGRSGRCNPGSSAWPPSL